MSSPPPVRDLDASHDEWDENTGGEIVFASVVSPRSRNWRLLRHAVGLLAFSALIGACVWLQAGESQVRLPSGAALPDLCVLRRWTGAPCPGCGLTRCFISLCHGDVRSAWIYNPAGILFFLLVAAQLPFHATQLLRAVRDLPERRPIRWIGNALMVIAALMIAQWIWRLLAWS